MNTPSEFYNNQMLEMVLSAITVALNEITQHPDESIIDIFNEEFRVFRTGLRMVDRYKIEVIDE